MISYFHEAKFFILGIGNTSSCRLNPSKTKGFKIIATVNPFDDFIVLKASTATEWSDPYPALAT